MAEIWTEIIYDTRTRGVLATQEFDHNRGDNHDWGFLEHHALVRLKKPSPKDGIHNKRLTEDLTDFEVDPTYISIEEKKQRNKDAELAEITQANTVAKLQALLKKKVKEKYANME